MLSRRSLIASLVCLPTAANAEVLVYRFGRWYYAPSPDERGEWRDDWGREARPQRHFAPSRAAAPVPADADPDDDDTADGLSSDERQARLSRSSIRRQVVRFDGYTPGTIVVATGERRLYLVQNDGATALRYGVGVGRQGFSWKGTETVSAKRKWPDWTPPAEMRARDPKLPERMDGGLNNPLGARALYLGDTLYRIHGTNDPSSIGKSVSSGCIRLANADIIDLYDRVDVGATVVVV